MCQTLVSHELHLLSPNLGDQLLLVRLCSHIELLTRPVSITAMEAQAVRVLLQINTRTCSYLQNQPSGDPSITSHHLKILYCKHISSFARVLMYSRNRRQLQPMTPPTSGQVM